MWPVSSYRLSHVAYTHLQVEIRRGGNKWTCRQTRGAESETGGEGPYGAVTHYRKPRDVFLTLLQLWQTIKYSDGRIYSLICSDNFNLVLLSFVCCKLLSIVCDSLLFLITCMTVKLTLVVFYWHILCCAVRNPDQESLTEVSCLSLNTASVFMSKTLKMSENNYLDRISPISVKLKQIEIKWADLKMKRQSFYWFIWWHSWLNLSMFIYKMLCTDI